ncbi:SusE domain-containing protein [Flavihumibacter petaseus]|uniref:SusE outer membrane protein domain-containing protein n=1 Tax=Flavihumibacter petaseus NBRC 106054 TaxID=1220578 RepID=A0A0E9N490_9BACT|nr:SusE domain-containing protein [Flavihumibacter petaseus]GAO44644.1 hypothetical protein FPE01S_03_06830 [Flavihumibacter petaseus NBRC 106054]
MKRFLKQLLFAATGILALAGCEKDKNLDHTKVSEVTNIFSPEDNQFIQLQQSASASAVFEWEQARAEDGGLVMYEVAFDKEGGDFSNPVYKMVSDNGGVINKATILHSVLNNIASMAGIQSNSNGKLKWTVISSKGINAVTSSQVRTIEVKTLAGFAVKPVELYLTGSATEGGENLAQAVPAKQTANGVFEVYTSLKAGTWNLADKTSGTPTTYSLDGDKIVAGGTATVTGDTKVYRMVLDFNSGAATITEIKAIELWFAPDNTTKFAIPYSGLGKFVAENVKIDFKQESWGRDERYKFRMKVNNGGDDTYEWYGSSNGDNQRPTTGTSPAYWYLFMLPNSDQWNNCYKFQTEADGVPLNVTVDFSATEHYTHVVQIR